MARPRTHPIGKSQHNKYAQFQFTCKICNTEFTIASRNIKRRKERNRPIDVCEKCLRDQTPEEKWGKEEAIARIRATVAKRRETCKTIYKDIYGNPVDNPMRDPSILKQTQDTLEERTGFRHAAQVPEYRAKMAETMLKERGYRYMLESPENQEKMRVKLFEKYGEREPLNIPQFKEKQLQTMRKLYFVDHALQNPNLKLRQQQTIRVKYQNPDITNTFQVDEVKKKRTETMLARYNRRSAPRKVNASNFEKSVASKLYYLFKEGSLSHLHLHTKQHISFKRADITPNRIYSHEYDIGIYNIFDELIILIDCDGVYFHAYDRDYNGMQSREEYDENRLFSMPDNVICHIIIEGKVSEGIAELARILQFDFDSWIEDQYNECVKIEFPYPCYSENVIRDSYPKLCDVGRIPSNKADNTPKNFSLANRTGDIIISHFHPSIYNALCKGKMSPCDAWYIEDSTHFRFMLYHMISNRFIYKNNVDPQKILQGFNVSRNRAAKVSVFSAAKAKLLLQRYASEFDTIFDPFSGYSGRMLGTVSLGKKYIGQDINTTTVKESNDMIQWFKDNDIAINASVSVKDVQHDTGTYDCLFTCPPYGNKEIWWDNGKYIESPYSAEEWIDICLKNYTCKRYIFIVDKVSEKYKKYDIEKISNISHFHNTGEEIFESIIVVDRE